MSYALEGGLSKSSVFHFAIGNVLSAFDGRPNDVLKLSVSAGKI